MALDADRAWGESRGDERQQEQLDAHDPDKQDSPNRAAGRHARIVKRRGIQHVQQQREAAHQGEIHGQDDEGARPTHPATQFLQDNRVAQQGKIQPRPEDARLNRFGNWGGYVSVAHQDTMPLVTFMNTVSRSCDCSLKLTTGIPLLVSTCSISLPAVSSPSKSVRSRFLFCSSGRSTTCCTPAISASASFPSSARP